MFLINFHDGKSKKVLIKKNKALKKTWNIVRSDSELIGTEHPSVSREFEIGGFH